MSTSLGTLADGRYQLKRVLGQGGMAVVYEAYDRRLKTWRAIKILNPRVARSRNSRLRFEAEAQTMATLHHPNIVAVHDVAQDGPHAFMVMELVRGGNLWDQVRANGAFAPGRARARIEEVLQALAFAHGHSVVHRDIKPQNILAAPGGPPKVTDFGIARVASRTRNLTRTNAVMGTWAYMAPELRTNAKLASERSDVYATGATLYALLKNAEPFDLYASNLQEKNFAGMCQQLQELVLRATAYDPVERFESAEQMRQLVARARDTLQDAPPIPGGEARGGDDSEGRHSSVTYEMDFAGSAQGEDGLAVAEQGGEPAPPAPLPGLADTVPFVERPDAGAGSAGEARSADSEHSLENDPEIRWPTHARPRSPRIMAVLAVLAAVVTLSIAWRTLGPGQEESALQDGPASGGAELQAKSRARAWLDRKRAEQGGRAEADERALEGEQEEIARLATHQERFERWREAVPSPRGPRASAPVGPVSEVGSEAQAVRTEGEAGEAAASDEAGQDASAPDEALLDMEEDAALADVDTGERAHYAGLEEHAAAPQESFNPRQVDAIIEADASIQACFEAYRMTHGDMPMVTMSYIILPSGGVSSVSLSKVFRGTTLESCVTASMARIAFPQFAEGPFMRRYVFRD